MSDSTRDSGTNAPVADDHAIGALLEQVRGLVRAARESAATAVNSLQVITSYEIGRMIVEYEQQGTQRAEYGKLVLKTLSERLTSEFGRGFSKSNLEYMRRFFLEYRNRLERIAQTPSGQSQGSSPMSTSEHPINIAQMPSAQLAAATIGQMSSGELGPISEKPSRKSAARAVPLQENARRPGGTDLAGRRQYLCLPIPALSAFQRGFEETADAVGPGVGRGRAAKRIEG